MPNPPSEAQSFSVKRAEVEFHNFASLGEPERAAAAYAEENRNRGAVIRNHLPFIGPLSPFLEIGANAGHTSYLLANEFGASGFALDISADALRHGIALMDHWGYTAAPVRIAGDAAHLPFRDRSLRLVMAFQMLSQFMNIESVFIEVKRVLAPGGIFLFADEPMLRLLSLRLYRAPYYNLMKPWERKLYDWGLLGYVVRDVIGAYQEESFGIRQNHTMYLSDWHRLIQRHFVAHEYETFVPERGWGERIVKRAAVRLDPHGSEWRAARLLGGTLAAVCRKEGQPPAAYPPIARLEEYLRCPDCQGSLQAAAGALRCPQCGYSAEEEGGVYNLLPAADRIELYPGDRADIIDFSVPGHEARLLQGWYELEGVKGAEYRWIGARASAVLKPVVKGSQRLRIRGQAHDLAFARNQPVKIRVSANGNLLREMRLERSGLYVFEADLPDAEEYKIDLEASPTFTAPPDDRLFGVTISMIRLIPSTPGK
ncbi:MAG: methyltransferase domain-containing protein [Acidobacteriota bacterium]|nr:methyltransferase domain-containing protein [Acidobacteriota bacterium]